MLQVFHGEYCVHNVRIMHNTAVLSTTPQDHMVSVDVKNLFTQVPIDEALRVVREKLTSDHIYLD